MPISWPRRAHAPDCSVSVLGCLILMCMMAPATGRAQGTRPFEASGGYTFLGGSEVVDGYGLGWMLAGAWNVTSWLGLHLEVGGNSHDDALGLLVVDSHFRTLVAGPQVGWSWGRLRPFARLLAGSTHVDLQVTSSFPFPSTGDFDDTHGTIQGGAGLDVPLRGNRTFIRIAFDSRRVFAPRAFSQQRVLTALVFGIGRER